MLILFQIYSNYLEAGLKHTKVTKLLRPTLFKEKKYLNEEGKLKKPSSYFCIHKVLHIFHTRLCRLCNVVTKRNAKMLNGSSQECVRDFTYKKLTESMNSAIIAVIHP